MMRCSKCNGTGQVQESVKSGVPSYICKMCNFQALGSTQVKQFEKRGGYCRECSGDFK